MRWCGLIRLSSHPPAILMCSDFLSERRVESRAFTAVTTNTIRMVARSSSVGLRAFSQHGIRRRAQLAIPGEGAALSVGTVAGRHASGEWRFGVPGESDRIVSVTSERLGSASWELAGIRRFLRLMAGGRDVLHAVRPPGA